MSHASSSRCSSLSEVEDPTRSRCRAARLNTVLFLHFCRAYLLIPGHMIDDAKKYADVDEEFKFNFLRDEYSKDSQSFLTKMRDYLPQELFHNVQPGTPFPRILTGRQVYYVINALEGKNFLRLVRAKFGVEIDQSVLDYSNRILYEEQKRSLLDYWIKQQQSVTASPLEELHRLLQRYEQDRQANVI